MITYRYLSDGTKVSAEVVLEPEIDEGARSYDPFTARWTSVDPLSHKYLGLSPYNYCGNNPVLHVDKDGNIFETLWDIANVAMDAKSLASNIKEGKVGAALLDGASLVVDAAAVVLPGVPGGAGTALKLTSTADKAGDAIQAGKSIVKDVKEVKELHRPYLRKSTKESILQNTKKTPDNKSPDANTNEVIEGKYDIGHIHGKEFKTLMKDAEAKGLTQKEFNDLLNDSSLYQIELPSNNRSHRFEKK